MVDDVTYDVIALYEDHEAEEIASALKDTYDPALIRECLEEVKELADSEQLFTKDEYEDYIMDFKKRPTVVKALDVYKRQGEGRRDQWCKTLCFCR